LFLLVGGAGAIVGMWLGGKGADWNAGYTLLTVLVGQIVNFALLLVAVRSPVGMALSLFTASAFGFAFSTPMQIRILHGARAAPRLAATLVSSAYNIGIAIGAFLGASLLNAGLDYSMLPAAGIVTSGIALVVALLSLAASRRTARMVAA
jgi:DHA1 family inner membrane transport protein